MADPAPKRTTPRGRARREQLLDAAQQIATDEGLEALTVARLAGDVGLAVGALYRHFDGKEALLGALQARAIADFHLAMQARVERSRRELSDRGVAEDVRSLALALIAFSAYPTEADRAPARYRMLDAFLSAPDPVLSEQGARALEEVVSPIVVTCAELLGDAAAVGALAPGDQVQRTHAAWAALHGLGHFRKRDRLVPEHLRTPALLRVLLRDLFAAWGARPQAFDAAWPLAVEAD